MRILHVITSLETGGAERLMVELLPLLLEASNVVELLLFDGKETHLKHELQQKGVIIHELSKKGRVNKLFGGVYNPLNIIKLRRFLRNYDILHTHNTACQLYVPIAKLITGSKSTLITTEHNSTNRRRSMDWFKPIDKWMYRQYNAIICIADQTRVNLENHIGNQSKMITIYNGVNLAKYLQQINDVSVRSEYVLTMVAAFRPQKDQDTLLRALTHLPDSYRLQFVGSGEREERVKSLCCDLALDRRVTFLGVRSDVSCILRKSDIVVLSSHWEGLSLSSIEGMASGRPFIASDVDGLREIVGGAGLLFKQGDDVELANKIQWLCEHPDEYREVAKRCQERACQYDISIMAEKYLQLYNGMI